MTNGGHPHSTTTETKPESATAKNSEKAEPKKDGQQK